jgi:hypothetical protein
MRNSEEKCGKPWGDRGYARIGGGGRMINSKEGPALNYTHSTIIMSANVLTKFNAHVFFRTATSKRTDSTSRVIQNMAAAVKFNKLVMTQGLSCRSGCNSTILLLHVIPIAG